MNKDENLKQLIKDIHKVNKRAIKVKMNKGERLFDLYYELAQEYAKYTGQTYYFGTNLNYEDFRGYLKIFKELLKIKRFLRSR